MNKAASSLHLQEFILLAGNSYSALSSMLVQQPRLKSQQPTTNSTATCNKKSATATATANSNQHSAQGAKGIWNYNSNNPIAISTSICIIRSNKATTQLQVTIMSYIARNPTKEYEYMTNSSWPTTSHQTQIRKCNILCKFSYQMTQIQLIQLNRTSLKQRPFESHKRKQLSTNP